MGGREVGRGGERRGEEGSWRGGGGEREGTMGYARIMESFHGGSFTLLQHSCGRQNRAHPRPSRSALTCRCAPTRRRSAAGVARGIPGRGEKHPRGGRGERTRGERHWRGGGRCSLRTIVSISSFPAPSTRVRVESGLHASSRGGSWRHASSRGVRRELQLLPRELGLHDSIATTSISQYRGPLSQQVCAKTSSSCQKKEDHVHTTPFPSRGGTNVVPFLFHHEDITGSFCTTLITSIRDFTFTIHTRGTRRSTASYSTKLKLAITIKPSTTT